MDHIMPMNYLPGDSRLIDQIVYELKSQGIFDQFRKECIADVDTKPAYQNLSQRVEGSVMNFLKKQKFSKELNKNQLREQLRKNITESGFLDSGVARIVDQVVNPKINTIFLPKVVDVVYQILGLERPNQELRVKENKPANIEDLLPNDLEAVSPESVHDHTFDGNPDKKEEFIEEQNESLNSSGSKVEDESPPFEPLEENPKFSMHEETSIESHISRNSASQESSHNAGVQSTNMEISQDNSQNSLDSEENLSIVTSADADEPILDASNDTEKDEYKTDAKSLQTEKNEKVDSSTENRKNEKHERKSYNKQKVSRSDRDKRDGKDERGRSKPENKSKDYKDKSSSKYHSSAKDHSNGSDSVDRDKHHKRDEKDREKRRSRSKDRREKGRESAKEKDKIRSSRDRHDKERHKSEKDKSEDIKKTNRDKPERERSASFKQDKERSHSKSSTSRHEEKSKEKRSSSSSGRHKECKPRSDKDRASKSTKKEENKVTDDHYSAKNKKNKRRSTDRDSNDGSSKMNKNSNFTDISSSSNKGSVKDSSDVSGNNGGGDTSNSDRTSEAPVDNTNLSVQPPIKYLKPKFASNIREAMKIMKIRKQLAKLERENQLGLTNIYDKEEQQNDVTIENSDANSNESEGLILKSRDLSLKTFEALEARLAQEMALVDHNTYCDEEDDSREYSPVTTENCDDKLSGFAAENTNKETLNSISGFIDKIDYNKEDVKVIANHQYNNGKMLRINNTKLNDKLMPKLSEANKEINLTKGNINNKTILEEYYGGPCHYLGNLEISHLHLEILNKEISNLERQVEEELLKMHNNFSKLKKRGKKRRSQSTENNNCISSDFRPVTKKGLLSDANSNEANNRLYNNNLQPHSTFNLPLIPLESDKHDEKKEIIVKRRTVNRGSSSKRYTNEDLYKPRPFLGGSSSRRRTATQQNTDTTF